MCTLDSLKHIIVLYSPDLTVPNNEALKPMRPLPERHRAAVTQLYSNQACGLHSLYF